MKKAASIFLVLLILFAIIGLIGIRHFNNLYFKEIPNYLTYSSDSKPIDFVWAEGVYGDYIETHAAMLIPVRIKGMPNKFYMQFDTGAPSTLIYGNTLKSLKEYDLNVKEVIKEDKLYIQNLDFSLGGSKVSMTTIQILEDYGNSFDRNDTISEIKIGTVGADFMDERITLIDFKNQFIQVYKQRPSWMGPLPNFKPFDFKGRRFMLPAKIDGEELELFYDSGSSAFGLITSKNRYDSYTNKNFKEIKYNANKWGDALPIYHKDTDRLLEIGGANLGLKRVSYVDMYANYQKLMTPFTRIGGWLGNKPFTESTLILDTKKQEFVIIKNAIDHDH